MSIPGYEHQKLTAFWMDPRHQPVASPPFTENRGPEKGSDLIKVKQLLLAAGESRDVWRDRKCFPDF